MKVVTGDILNNRYGLIGHQVNCQLVMGAGIAKSIRNLYPTVFTQYKRMFDKVPPRKRLGRAHMAEAIPNTLYIANLFGQFHYLPRNVKHTNYPALTIALRQMRHWRDMTKGKAFPIYLPFGIGCGLAGGDWNVVYGIIRDVVPDATIVKLPQTINK